MNNVPMKSLKSHRYGTKQLTAGDPFDAHPNDVKLLKVLGRAEEVFNEPQRSAPQKTTQRRQQSTSQRGNGGRYNRRDQRARS